MGDHEVTRLLQDWRAGRRQALDELVPLVHEELQRLAHHYMRSERSGHTLQTTALVNEAYLKLVGADVPWQDRVHFFAVAARSMRRILVDHARARDSAKRGGKMVQVTLNDELDLPAGGDEIDLAGLDEALARLERQDPRKGRVIELAYFGGLKVREIADLLGVSASTIEKDLRFSRAFLRSELEG